MIVHQLTSHVQNSVYLYNICVRISAIAKYNITIAYYRYLINRGHRRAAADLLKVFGPCRPPDFRVYVFNVPRTFYECVPPQPSPFAYTAARRTNQPIKRHGLKDTRCSRMATMRFVFVIPVRARACVLLIRSNVRVPQ